MLIHKWIKFVQLILQFLVKWLWSYCPKCALCLVCALCQVSRWSVKSEYLILSAKKKLWQMCSQKYRCKSHGSQKKLVMSLESQIQFNIQVKIQILTCMIKWLVKRKYCFHLKLHLSYAGVMSSDPETDLAEIFLKHFYLILASISSLKFILLQLEGPPTQCCRCFPLHV